jgi:hypothetical protein
MALPGDPLPVLPPGAPLIDPPARALTERLHAPHPVTRVASAARRIAGALALAVLLGAAPAAPSHAQEAPVPACAAATAGQLSSQAGVRCACRFFPASALAAMPAGYRWDCGILQARLGGDLLVDLNPYPYPLPDALSIELVIVPDQPPGWPRPQR